VFVCVYVHNLLDMCVYVCVCVCMYVILSHTSGLQD